MYNFAMNFGSVNLTV